MKDTRDATHGDSHDFSTFVGGHFKDFDRAEATALDLLRVGFDPEQITVIVNDEARQRVLELRPELADLREGRIATSVELDKERKTLKGAGVGGSAGGTVGAVAAAIAAIGTTLAVPPLGIVVAGPLAAALAGAGAG